METKNNIQPNLDELWIIKKVIHRLTFVKKLF